MNDDVKLLDTYDWREVFGEPYPYRNGQESPAQTPFREATVIPGHEVDPAPFTRADVHHIAHIEEDSPEGYGSWEGWCVVLLKDGRWACLEGWCDTSGWGCQDNAERTVAPTYEIAVRFGLSDSARKKLGIDLEKIS